MKITRINAEEPTKNTESTNVNFKAIKLNRSTLKMAKPLAEDTLTLRKSLPDNNTAPVKKYFGNPNIGPGGSNNPNDKDFTAADAAIIGAITAIGIGLSML